MKKPDLFYVEVMVNEQDLDPYRFFFLDESERDDFAEALSGYLGADGEPLYGAEQDHLYKKAEDAIDAVKSYMGWAELPSDPEEGEDA